MKNPLTSSGGSSAVPCNGRALLHRTEHPVAERIGRTVRAFPMHRQTRPAEAPSLGTSSPAWSAGPARRIAVKVRNRILFLDPAEVLSVQAKGNYVLLERESKSYLVREPISTMARKLRSNGFIQIHRSLLINAAGVEEIHRCGTGEYIVQIRGGKHFTATRSYKKNLKSLAEVWIGAHPLLEE